MNNRFLAKFGFSPNDNMNQDSVETIEGVIQNQEISRHLQAPQSSESPRYYQFAENNAIEFQSNMFGDETKMVVSLSQQDVMFLNQLAVSKNTTVENLMKLFFTTFVNTMM